MQCLGKEGAYLADSSRTDERTGKDGRCAAPATEQPAYAETDGELRGIECQNQGCPGHERDAGES